MMYTSVKYPRTAHMPLSPSYTMDDERMIDFSYFEQGGENVVITEKMDGENTTLYSTHWHARGLGIPRHHPSRDWLTSFWASKKEFIPEGWRICGENLYAKHSIAYHNLHSYFQGFSVWDKDNRALDWKATVDFFDRAGILTVPVLYVGPFSYEVLTTIVNALELSAQEGIVMRPVGPIPYDQFGSRVAKWVRPDHVKVETKHWFHAKVVKNHLAG